MIVDYETCIKKGSFYAHSSYDTIPLSFIIHHHNSWLSLSLSLSSLPLSSSSPLSPCSGPESYPRVAKIVATWDLGGGIVKGDTGEDCPWWVFLVGAPEG